MTYNPAKLFPAQRAIIKSKKRFKVLVCGRRFGKTTIAVKMLCAALKKGQRAAYFAPTQRMATEVWQAINACLHKLIVRRSESERRLELNNGGVFESWSLAGGAGETVRGRKYHFIVMDEAALFPSGDVWYGAIRPLLTDYRGKALFASTPRGRNWFWELYQMGLSDAHSDCQSWHYPTADNPFIDPDEIEDAQHGMPERFFQQEYLAEFLDSSGLVFRNLDRVCTAQPQPEAQPGVHYYFGVDWGKDNDYTCISVMTADGQQVYLERFNRIGWTYQRGKLQALYDRYRPVVIVAEQNSIGSVNIEALQMLGLPVTGFLTTATSKPPLIDHLALSMETETVTLLDDEVLKHELALYEMTRTKYGWSYSAPPGGHDDTVIATALSLWAVRERRGVSIDFV